MFYGDTPLETLFGNNLDRGMVVNVASFAIACHILQVNSLFAMSVSIMNRNLNKKKRQKYIVYQYLYIINLQLNLDANISISARNQNRAHTEHFAKTWSINVEDKNKTLKN